MTAPRGGEKVEPPATRHMRMPPTFKGFRTAIAKRDGARHGGAPTTRSKPLPNPQPKSRKAKRKISPSRVENDNRRKEPSADPRADQKARSAARPWSTGIAPPTNCLQRPTPSQFTVRVTLSVTGCPSTRFREGGECYNMLQVSANHLFMPVFHTHHVDCPSSPDWPRVRSRDAVV
jgi:hypothetical protein